MGYSNVASITLHNFFARKSYNENSKAYYEVNENIDLSYYR